MEVACCRKVPVGFNEETRQAGHHLCLHLSGMCWLSFYIPYIHPLDIEILLFTVNNQEMCFISMEEFHKLIYITGKKR